MKTDNMLFIHHKGRSTVRKTGQQTEYCSDDITKGNSSNNLGYWRQ